MLPNLYDLTGGNYRIHRTVTYPAFSASRIVFDTAVTAVGSDWTTKITVSGNYDGPTDIVGVRDYQASWTTDGKTLFEEGRTTLELASGGTLESVWSSSIVPERPRFDRFPQGGETIHVTFSPFKIDGNKMSYDWHGEVTETRRQDATGNP